MKDDPMMRRLAVLIAGPLACGLFAAACGSSGSGRPPVASISSSPSASATSPGSAKASALAYARCMRGHGITDFPDPDAHGDLSLDPKPGSDLDPNNPAYKAANSACTSLLPPRKAPPKDLKAKNLAYARCMRAHGISDFPDPDPDGNLQIHPTPGSDLDANNPQFKAANEVCKHYLPGGGAGAGLNSGSTGGAS
jgi:hypothetical protein